jgi:hypothetical protein
MSIHSHEGFGIEKSWLVKSLYLLQSTTSFIKDVNLGQQELGLGNRKVMALKNYLIQGKMIKKIKQDYMLTDFAKVLIKNDPNLYQNETIIAIFYQLACEPTRGEIFYWYMNEFEMRHFDKKSLLERLQASYPDKAQRTLENAWNSLHLTLTNKELGLGEECGWMKEKRGAIFEKGYPEKGSFSIGIFAFALIDYARRLGTSSLNLQEIISGKGSPGKVFNLPADMVDNMLADLETRYRKELITYSKTAGLNSVGIVTVDP